MLDLFLKLIDRLIDLARRREEQKRTQFSDAIAPTFEAFEALHQNYIDALGRYIVLLSDSVQKMNTKHPVLKELRLDTLKSAHLRAKLAALLPRGSSERAREFFGAMNQYSTGVSDAGNYIELLSRYLTSLTRRVGEEQMYALMTDIEKVEPASYQVTSDPVREALDAIMAALDSVGDSMDRLPNERYQRRLRELCIGAAEHMMCQTQEAYARVVKAFGSLREELLNQG